MTPGARFGTLFFTAASITPVAAELTLRQVVPRTAYHHLTILMGAMFEPAITSSTFDT